MSGKIEAEFNQINDENRWNQVFMEIRVRCDKEATEKHFSTSESERSKNRTLNRYRDVNPYDHSRIIIKRGKTDYINANLVKMERADRKYILTQGPLSDTVGHFWMMIWEQNSKAILMLNKLVEKMQIKCHLYWPQKIGAKNILNLTDVGLTVEYMKCEQYTNYCKRIFKLTDTESKASREIIQFNYTTWPDFGIPSSPVAFLRFLEKVRESGALSSDVGPAVVHCSAGIGRSGTFCLVDICLVLIEKEGENNVSVQDILFELRRYRMGLIQTADQLYFSYQAIIKGVKLLKDSKFTDFEEVPIISTENDLGDGYEDDILGGGDEQPPPIPPRSGSLKPPIPNSESFNDFTNANANNISSSITTTTSSSNASATKDATNNLINNEKSATDQQMEKIPQSDNSTLNSSLNSRPLPPIPHQGSNSLVSVNESGSEMSSSDEYEPDDDKYDEDECSGVNNGKAENNNSNSNGNTADDKILNGLNGNTDPQNEEFDSKSFVEGPDGMKEIRRRKRQERQVNMEQKVNEMKRKQREAEVDKSKKKKQRRQIQLD
ncbi:PTPN2 family protein [Megaselia abdita]